MNLENIDSANGSMFPGDVTTGCYNYFNDHCRCHCWCEKRWNYCPECGQNLNGWSMTTTGGDMHYCDGVGGTTTVGTSDHVKEVLTKFDTGYDMYSFNTDSITTEDTMENGMGTDI